MGPTPPPMDTYPHCWYLVAITGDLFKLVHWGGPHPPPPPMVLTASGGAATETQYSWQAGCTHPTGMLSCVKLFVLRSMNIMDSIH